MADAVNQLRKALRQSYAIERELGSGGMAIVYLAQDLKHDRRVAVKVLRPELAATLGPDRFLREIKIAAGLHHPHILPLYDSGQAGGSLYYVMPYVEGRSLRSRLNQEVELPVADVVRILREVVDALAYAHGRGLVHRDIKPDNVMLSGRHALVTDFGVAKALSEATGRNHLTTAGVALGTPAYMAPEQAAADPHMDHRIDIYAVGAMAYEMLTGRTPFTATSAHAMLAAHVTEAVEPVTKHRATVPPVLNEWILRCLAKNPADRWQSAEEMLPVLESLAATPTAGITPTDTRPLAALPTAKRRRRGVAVFVVFALIAIPFATRMITRRSDPITLGRTIQVTDAAGVEYQPALSPDGKMIVYRVAGNPGGLFVRQVSGGRTVELTQGIPGTHLAPSWSPDGTQLVFVTESPGGKAISSIPALGGHPKRLIEFPARAIVRSPAWSPDGRQLAYAVDDSVFIAAADGSNPRRMVVAAEADALAWSPDGLRLAYVQGNGQAFNLAPSSIRVAPARGGESVQVTTNDFANASPEWTADGHLLFVSNRDGTRDIYRIRVRSSGAPAAEPERVTTGLNAHQIALPRAGGLLAYSQWKNVINVAAVSRRNPTAPPRAVTTGSQTVENFSASEDGRWLAFDSNRRGNADIYRVPTSGGEPEQLTDHPADDFQPAWSPNGREIVFHSFRTGNRDLFVMSADGKSVQQVTNHPAQDRAAGWLADGRVVFSSDRTGRYEIYLAERNASGWGEARQISLEGGAAGSGSPDGRMISYLCGPALCIRDVSGGDPRRLATGLSRGSVPGGAYDYFWTPDSRSILYAATDSAGRRAIWSVPVNGGRPTIAVPNWTYGGNLAMDGEYIYVQIPDNQSDIWLVEINR